MWFEFHGPDTSPKDRWWSLYRLPFGKQTGDLQRSILDLDNYVQMQSSWSYRARGGLWLLFTVWNLCPFIWWLSYSGITVWVLEGLFVGLSISLVHFWSATKKAVQNLDIWLTRWNRVQNLGAVEVALTLEGLVKHRLMVEYRVTDSSLAFCQLWVFGVDWLKKLINF